LFITLLARLHENSYTAVVVKLSAQTGQCLWYHAIKFTRWQHPAVRHRARFIVYGTTCYYLFYHHHNRVTHVVNCKVLCITWTSSLAGCYQLSSWLLVIFGTMLHSVCF